MATTLTEGSAKSLSGIKVELESVLPITFSPDMTCSLNAKYSIYPALKPTTLPKIMFFGMGIGGKYNTTDDAGAAAGNPLRAEMDLYKPIPFRCLTEDEDYQLTSAERAQYRMRYPTTINGVKYFCYYLKKLEFVDSIDFTITDPVTHEETPYTLDPANLYPKIQVPSTTGTVDASVSEVIASATATANFTGPEVIEAINVLYNGDLRYGVISELAVYSGVDTVVDDFNVQGQQFSYTESIYTQMVTKYTWLGVAMTNPTANESMKVQFTSGSNLVVSTAG